MRKGSIILLLMLSINIVSYGLAFSCSDAGASCGSEFDNSVIGFFFNINEDANLASADGLSVNETFRSTVEGSLTQEIGVATAGDSGAIGFLDVVKMTIAGIALLTPLPFLAMLDGFGMPLLYLMAFLIVMFAFYAIAIIEFLRGVEL